MGLVPEDNGSNSYFTPSSVPSSNRINHKKELVFYFFNKMLESIIDTYDAYVKIENLESITSSQHFSCKLEEMLCMSDKSESGEDDDGPEDDIQKRTSFDISTSLSTEKPSTKQQSSQKKYGDDSLDDLFDANISGISWIMESIIENVTIKFKNGNKYEGSVFGMLMHGLGKFSWANGTTYEGDFVNGEITGKGELILPDSSNYTGEFLNGYRHGCGVMNVAETNAIYQGYWKAGMKNGKGWQQFAPNSWYDGEWKDNAMSGNGTRQYPSGSRYQGEWKYGLRDGRGCMVISNNDFYYGYWEVGMRNGCGEYIWNTHYNKTFTVPVQNSYYGFWKDDLMHGLGLINFGMISGTRYAGNFENNEKHGAGVILCENGTTIESNPLFLHNKPVHVSKAGSISISCEVSSDIPSEYWIEESTVTTQSYTKPERKDKIFHILSQKLRLPVVTKFAPNIVANLDVCKLTFPKFEERFHSLFIPFNTPTEMINLQYYMKKINNIYVNANSNSNTSSHISVNSPGWKTNTTVCELILPSELKQTSMFCMKQSPSKDQFACEERNLRNTITCHIPKLKQIYIQYSQVACLHKVKYDTLLIRLFLWQLYRDCKIPQKGITLTEIDKLMMENADIELEDMHCPFEVIYFWQFLHSLMILAVHLYMNEIEYVHEHVLQNCLLKLLENDIYPNRGRHIGRALFDYLDILPIQAVYQWFTGFEQPLTTIKFLRNACTVNNCDPPDYFKEHHNNTEEEIKTGINAYPVGLLLAYLYDEQLNLQTEPIQKSLKPYVRDTYKYKLFFLKSLGAKKILEILSQITPNIIIDDEIINMNQEMCFLEFYEAILMCTQELINRQNRQKRKEKMEEIMAQVENLSHGLEHHEKHKLKKISRKKFF